MSLKIAIQPDETKHHNGERQSYSERWMELAQNEGIEAILVDVFSEDIVDQIAKCDAFMWRFLPSAHPRLYAKRLLCAVEQGLGIPVFPSVNTAWHAEDKVGQYYLLESAGIPTPATHVFWNREQAERFCESAKYPFVLKLAIGYRAVNVRLVRDRGAAQYYVNQLFGPGIVSLGYRPASPFRLFLRRLRSASENIKGRYPNAPNAEAEMQHGYFYAQEFLPGNEFDVRVIITGNRAFTLRRFNRPGDFRASGSGLQDWNPEHIDKDAIRLAFQVARQLDVQTVAMDVLRREAEPVITELGFTYPTWSKRDCPGHWVLDGEPASGHLRWVDRCLQGEDAIFADFVAQVRGGSTEAQGSSVMSALDI